MIGHKAPISGVATFEDQYVASSGYDNQVILWDAQTKRALSRGWHDHLANSCRFSPSGKYLVSASSDYSIRIWSVPTMQLLSIAPHHNDDVEMACFNPSESQIATASRDHLVRTFDLSGRLLHSFQGHTADVISVEWNEDGSELISSSDDGTIRRWNAQTGECLETIDMGGIETDTIVIANDNTIFAGNDEGEIIACLGDRQDKYKAHRAGIKRLVYDKSQSLLISLSYDRHCAVFQHKGQNRLEQIDLTEFPSAIWPRSCAVSGSDTLVFGSFGTSFASYSLKTKKWDTSNVDDTHGVNAVASYEQHYYTVGDAGIVKCESVPIYKLGTLCNFLTPVGNTMIAGGQLGIVYDAMTGKEYHQHHSPLNCACTFVKDQNIYTAVGTYTGEALIFMWTPEKGLEFIHSLAAHENAIKGLSTDGHTLFSVDATGAAAWHDVKNWKETRRVENAHDKICNGCDCLGPNQFVSVSRDLTLRIWKENQDAQIIQTPHTNSIKCTAVSGNRRYIATGSYSGNVHVYDVESQQWSHLDRPTTSGISCVTAHPNGTDFWASSYDGKVYQIQGEQNAF